MLVPHSRLQTGDGTVVEHFAGVDVGECATPQFFDLDGDGKKDLIVGNRRGLLSYYHNEGVNIPVFQKVTDTLGEVDMRNFELSYFGYSVPCFYRDAEHGTVLFCGGEQGEVAYYKHVDGNLAGVFEKAEGNLAETIDGVAHGFREGRRAGVAVADLNGDGRPELLLGNYAGGAAFFRGAVPPVHTSVPANTRNEVRVWPNPASECVHVQGTQPLRHVVLYDLYGRIILAVNEIGDDSVTLDLSGLAPGVYLLRTKNGAAVKVVVAR